MGTPVGDAGNEELTFTGNDQQLTAYHSSVQFSESYHTGMIVRSSSSRPEASTAGAAGNVHRD